MKVPILSRLNIEKHWSIDEEIWSCGRRLHYEKLQLTRPQLPGWFCNSGTDTWKKILNRVDNKKPNSTEGILGCGANQE